MVEVMNINPLLFKSQIPESVENIMQTFFQLAEDNITAINFFTLIRSNKRGKADILLEATYDDVIVYWSDEPPVDMCFSYGLLGEFMREQMLRKHKLRDGEITHLEYLEWKLICRIPVMLVKNTSELKDGETK